ncbi:MAG: AAA family ATPase [Deltaproteobacteria bacterium]|nr:AAA family ATPase [Deltaproteobacteria bacterium]
MQCLRCRHDGPEAAKFCAECGAPLTATCGSCNVTLPPGAKFCAECGQPALRTVSAQEPRAYTPNHLVEKILTSRAALEGERKQVTVLFADLKSSMELAEQVDPEEWHSILDRFFQILAEGVHRYEGTINQYTGDGIMALFGAPLAHEDHAHRACWAALTLRDETRRYADELRLGRGLNFSVRMGLNSGEVVVGKIGDDLRMDYTAQGHTVGLAARMEQLAEPGSVFLTDATARRVDGFFQLRDLGPSTVKGVREPVHVYALEGVGQLRTRLDLSRARGLSRFVGRANEVRTIELALERALTGNGQVVGVVGEPGVGKSRLCSEFVERCRARNLTVQQGHCITHGKLLPLTPILEVLRAIFGIRPEDDDREARRKIAGTLVLLAEEVREMLPLVFDTMGVPDPEHPAPAMDPEVRQRRLFEFLKRMIRARSAREPAVLFLDDLHWIDAASDAYLANWVEAVRGTRTLILLNFRPEYRVPWMATSYYQQLPLEPLGPDAIEELLGYLLGGDTSLRAIRALIGERAAGNPFFVEEIVLALVEAGQLEGTRGAYRLGAPVAALAIPPTVQAILAARVDRLPEREKSILQTAAVIGRVASEPLLRRVSGVPPAELAAALQALVAREFLYEGALYPEAEYAFKHPLTREVAYGSQLSERRQRTHAEVARAMIDLDPPGLDERAALVAHHFENAAAAAEAAAWYARAGKWIMLRDSAAGLTHWRQSFELAHAAPESPQTTALALAAYSPIFMLSTRVGMPLDEVARVFEAASALVRRRGDERAFALLKLRYDTTRVWLGGPLDELRTAVAEAKRLAAEAGDRPLLGIAVLSECLLHYVQGVSSSLLRASDEALTLLDEYPSLELGGSPNPHPRILFFRVFALALLGRAEAAGQERECLLAAATDVYAIDPDALVIAHATRANVIEWTGWDAEDALAHARRAVEIAEQEGSPLIRIFVYMALAKVHLQRGDWEEALTAAEHAQVLRHEALQFEGATLALTAHAWLRLGNLERAGVLADEAVASTRAGGTLGSEIEARIVRARVLIGLGDGLTLAAARVDLARALELIAETGARACEPHVREILADLAAAEGDPTARERELRAAHRLYTEMGIAPHAERVTKALVTAGACPS